MCLDEEHISKSKEEVLKEICEPRIEDIHQNKDILHQRAVWMHISLNNLVIGIFLVAIFIILNISPSFYVTIITLLLSVVITLVSYWFETKHFSKKMGIEK
ncbi:hypothetical protein FGU46_01155 [Methanobacterium sp. CWC-01]|nr:hypothetical protein FGU46_01155 [Methanobacterium sp. CWC-01]